MPSTKTSLILSLLTLLLVSVQAQAQTERIRAKVYLRYSSDKWKIVDSSVYSYHTGRGGINTGAREAAMYDRYVNYTFDSSRYTPATIIADTFDAAGRKLSSSWQQFRSGAWQPSQRFEYTYNSYGDTLSKSLLLWFPLEKEWQPYSHYTITYDAGRHRLLDLGQQLSNAGWYGNSTLDSTRYDSLGHRAATIHLIWDSTGRWQPRTADFYSYDRYDRRTRDLSMVATSAGWSRYSLDSFSYDGHDSLTGETTMRWLERPRGWKVVMQHLYQYDDQSARALITHREYNLENDTVGGIMADSTTYGEHHRIEALYHLNLEDGIMVPGTMDQYEYNSKQRMIAVVSSVNLDGKWQPVSRSDYQYDNNGYRTSYTLSSYTDGRWIPELSEREYYEGVK